MKYTRKKNTYHDNFHDSLWYDILYSMQFLQVGGPMCCLQTDFEHWEQ